VKSLVEEFTSILLLRKRLGVAVRHLPGAEAWLDRHARDPAATKRMMHAFAQRGQPQPGEFIICLLLRGAAHFPDNVATVCHDCGTPVETAAGLPFWLLRICVFCATKRVEGAPHS
jgi:hypothetical protein